MKPLLALIVLVVALACASPLDLARDVPVAAGAAFDLLPPASFGRSLALEQTVEARRGEERTSIDCVLEIEPRELRLVGLTPFATVAFVVTLDAAGLHVENRVGGQLPADPRRILTDLQLALWPELPSLKGLSVVDRPAQSGGRERLLLRGGQEVVTIRYHAAGLPWEGPIEFSHAELGYTLRVTTSRWENLAP